MELSEGIAAMNYRALIRNNPENLNFYNDIFCAYPGNDKLMDLFLEQYQITKDLYESDMNKRVAKYYLVTIPLKPANTLVLLERMMVNLYANFKMSFLG